MKYLYPLLLFVVISPTESKGDSLHSIELEIKQNELHTVTENKSAEKTRQSLMKLRQFIEEPVFKNNDASEPIYNICTAYLKEFGKTTAKFIQCSIEKARPFRFCEMCVVEYKRSMTIFENILQDDATKSGCKDILLKADRIQVLDQVYNNIKNIWAQAYCDECFEPDSIQEFDNGTVTFHFSEMAKEFNIMFNNVTKCINKHTNTSLHDLLQEHMNGSVCVECLDVYKALNSKFKEAMVISKEEVCMDLVDMMNYTRITWGFTLNCTMSHSTNAGVVIIAVIIAVGTISFYVVTGLRGRRMEKKIMKQKRMSSRSAAALYGSTVESQQDDINEDVSNNRVVFS